MIIAVVNQSQRLAGQNALISQMTAACSAQLHAAAPLWGRTASSAVFTSSVAAAKASARKIITIKDNPDQPDAEGYHTEDSDGTVWGVVFTDPVYASGGTATQGEIAVSGVLSHEILEMWGDPTVNLWAEDPKGVEWAYELCDAVQSGWYLQNGVSVSNFLLPSFFDATPPAGAKFDFQGTLHAPFTLAKGGYSAVRRNGKEKQIFGEIPKWKHAMMEMKEHHGRTRHRMR